MSLFKLSLLTSLLIVLGACSNPMSSDSVSPVKQTYVQMTEHSYGQDSAWWFFGDGKIMVAEKYKISNAAGYMPVRHARGTYTYNKKDNTINMMLYSNVRMTINTINLYDSLAPVLALPMVNSYADSFAVCSAFISELGMGGTCDTNYSYVYRRVTVRDTNYVSMENTVLQIDTIMDVSCDGAVPEKVLTDRMLPYYIVGDPDSWQCTYCQPQIATFEIVKWDSSELVLYNIDMQDTLDGWGWIGDGLNNPNHTAYNEMDAGY